MKVVRYLISICAVSLSFASSGYAGQARGKPFVLFTAPKTGTYLLSPLLTEITGRSQRLLIGYGIISRPLTEKAEFDSWIKRKNFLPTYLNYQFLERFKYQSILNCIIAKNDFLFSHAPYSPALEQLIKKRKAVVFFLDRDPRDRICSGARYYAAGSQCPFPLDWFQSLSFDEQISWMIQGTAWYNSARWMLEAFEGWRLSPQCCVVNFRRLVGPRGGGGSAAEQLAELRNIANALEVAISDQELLAIFNRCFGTGPTYADGSVGKWKRCFTQEHKALAKQHFGDYLIKLGYEENNNW